jgi:hypothetical protein
MIQGGNFKFKDYFLGSGRENLDIQPLDLRNTTASFHVLQEAAWPNFDVVAYGNRLRECFPSNY